MTSGTRTLLLALLWRVVFAALCGLLGASLGLLVRPLVHLTPAEAGVLVSCIALGYVLWMCCRR